MAQCIQCDRREKNLQARIYPAKLSLRIEEIRSFQDKQKLKEFTTSKPALQEMLKKFKEEKAETKNKKMWKENLTNKGKHLVNIVNQSIIKLV